MARPRIEFNDKGWEQIEKLCSIQCTAEEIGFVMGVHKDTVETRIREKYDISFSDYIKSHAVDGKISLRRKQFEVAMNGNTTMLIWLGKQHLAQRDFREGLMTVGDGGGKLIIDLNPPDESKP